MEEMERWNKDFNKIFFQKWFGRICWIVKVRYMVGDLAKDNKNKRIMKTADYVNRDYSKRHDYEERLKTVAMNLLEKEVRRYAYEFNGKPEEVYKKAISGDDNALFKLIQFDKTWLYLDWVKNKILDKEAQDDGVFLNKLSDAMRYKLKSRVRSKSKSDIEKQIYNYSNSVSLLQNLIPKEVGSPNDFISLLHKGLTSTLFEDDIFKLKDKEDNPLDKIDVLNDKDYFIKYVKRQAAM
jgi:hypothetical protein